MKINLTEGEEQALETEKHDLGIGVMPIIVFSLFMLVPVFIYNDNKTAGIIVAIVIGAFDSFFIFYFFYRIFMYLKTLKAIKVGQEIKCEFISSKAKYRIVSSDGQKLYSICMHYYNRFNEEKIFKTRPIYLSIVATFLEEKKLFSAKRLGNYVVITEAFK